MAVSTIALLTLCILAAALLYSSVGHAGASGYLAAMALFGIAPSVMKPTALMLNIVVAAIATVKFYRAGCFSWKLFWPFTITSIPLAFLGGGLSVPVATYKVVVGLVLLYAAFRLFRASYAAPVVVTRSVPALAAVAIGAVIGLLSGLIGVGGGIFLSPLLLFMGWAETRQASGVSAPFILVNSVAGLLGHLPTMTDLPAYVLLWIVAVVIGGYIGAEYGSRRLASATLRRLLAAVLVIAGCKLVLLV